MQVPNFPNLAAQVEGQTLVLDFGPRLNGAMLLGQPTVTITVADCSPQQDPDPQSRIDGAPIITTAPPPGGSNKLNGAVAFRFKNGVADVVYKIVCSCAASNGDTPELDNQFLCYAP